MDRVISNSAQLYTVHSDVRFCSALWFLHFPRNDPLEGVTQDARHKDQTAKQLQRGVVTASGIEE